MTFLMASRRGLPLGGSFPRRLTMSSLLLVNSNTKLTTSKATYTPRAPSERYGTTQLLVAPLSMVAARPGPSGTPKKNSSKRKPWHAASSTEAATTSPGIGARRTFSPDAAATGGSPGASSPRVETWASSTGTGGRGRSQASSYSAPGGRGGRGPSRGELANRVSSLLRSAEEASSREERCYRIVLQQSFLLAIMPMVSDDLTIQAEESWAVSIL